jgi:hypothetical protein
MILQIMIVSDLLKYERNMDVCKTLWGLLVKIKDIRKKKYSAWLLILLLLWLILIIFAGWI